METNSLIISTGLADLPQTAKSLIGEFQHRIILLEGDLGAGKTTLVKELLVQLGSTDAGSSPSYSLINEYVTTSESKIYHLDLYRLTSVEEAFALGLEDVLYSGHYCFVEWPQIIRDYLEPPYHYISIELDEAAHRRIKLSSVS